MLRRKAGLVFVATVLMLAVILAGSRSVLAEKKVLTATSIMYNNLRIDWYGWHRMMDLIEQRTGGNITFKRLDKGIIGDNVQMHEAVIKGSIDISKGWAPIMTNHSEAARALLLPFLFNFPDDMLWLLEAPEARELLDVIGKEAGVYVLSSGIYEERHFFNSKRPVRNMEDVKGLRIRTLESKSEQEWVAMTGARPGPSSFPELYQMLKTDVFDGYDGNFTVHDSMKYYEVTKYVTIMGYHNIGPLLLVNQKTWDNLSPEEKEIFHESAHQAMVENYGQGRRMVERARQVAIKHGNQIIEELEDRDKWVEAVQPYIEKCTKESPAIDKFVRAVRAYHAQYPRFPIDPNKPAPKSRW
jgi:TRAP-type C4-dicarboxylate transport system substrate-binding protein